MPKTGCTSKEDVRNLLVFQHDWTTHCIFKKARDEAKELDADCRILLNKGVCLLFYIFGTHIVIL